MRSKRVISFLFFIFLLTSCKETKITPARTIDSILNEHLLLGNSSNVTADPANANNFLIQKLQYTLSYNRDRGTPIWVSWHIRKDWLGNAPLQDDFRADNTLLTVGTGSQLQVTPAVALTVDTMYHRRTGPVR
jgi:endonuclease G